MSGHDARAQALTGATGLGAEAGVDVAAGRIADAGADVAAERGAVADVKPALERIAEVGSTNSELIARVRATLDRGEAVAPRFLVADRQTAGRGRHGRTWHATPGASITLSVAWPLAAADCSGLSLAVGVAVAEAIDPAPSRRARTVPGRGVGHDENGDRACDRALRVGIKWPNDLLLVDSTVPAREGRFGRKLAGILVETVPAGAERIAIVGIGVNVRAQSVPEARSGFASVDELDSEASTETVLAHIVAALAPALRRFAAAGFAPFAAGFADRDVLAGRRVVAGAVGEIEGVAAGVSPSGELQVRTASGVVTVLSGEPRIIEAALR